MPPLPRPVSSMIEGEFRPALPPPDPWVDTATSGLDLLRVMVRLGRNPIDPLGVRMVTEPYSYFGTSKRDFLYISDPALIRETFVEKRHVLVFNAIRQGMLKPIIRDGLIAAEGEPWKRARHAATSLFTPRAVARFADSMRSTTQDWADTAPVGEVSLDAWMSGLTYAVLKDALFADGLTADGAEVTEGLAKVLSRVGRPDIADLLRLPPIVPRLSKLRGRRAVRDFRGLVRDTICERRTRDHPGDDLLGLLMGSTAEDGSALAPDELEDNVVSFVGAGHETTARWLVWWLYLLSQDKSARDRAVAEADALDTCTDPATWKAQMPWLFATLEETLRLYPSAPFLSRTLTSPTRIGDLDLRVGSDVIVNIMAVHRHRGLWDDPDTFRPSRFLGKAREQVGRFQYLPFGVGHRICIGQRFAVQEAVVLGALLLRRFTFDYVGESDPWPHMRITISAEKGMPMRVVRRG